jgi:hypothetical protein
MIRYRSDERRPPAASLNRRSIGADGAVDI